MWMHRALMWLVSSMYFVCGCTELSFYSCGWLVLHWFYALWMHRALIVLMKNHPYRFTSENMADRTIHFKNLFKIKRKLLFLFTLALLFSCLNVLFPFLLVHASNCCSFSCFNVFPPVVFPFFACTWGCGVGLMV